MRLGEAMLPEFDHEMAGTRRTLERVPEDKLDFKPHEKSATMRWLASHLARIPTWATITIERDSLDVMEPDPHRGEQCRSCQELLETFDRNVAGARAAISGASDDTLTAKWTLLAGGKTIFQMPRFAVLRSMVMNHSIHHRAQLGVYLRMTDVPVPALYGPSADESGM